MKKVILLLVAVFCMSQFTFSQPPLISQGKPASASTSGGAGGPAMGNDGDVASRWESQSADNQWWQIDLGAEYYVSLVEIDWESASSKEYKIQLSNDPTFATGVTDIAHVTNQPTGQHSIAVIPCRIDVKGRYLRMYGMTRNTQYGHSFWEFRAYGMQTLTPVDVSFFVPHVAQYLEVNFTPADLNMGKMDMSAFKVPVPGSGK